MRAMKDSGVEWIGEIPDGWLISKIKRHFAVVCGATPSDDPENWAGEIPWIGPADMQDWGSISGGARSLTTKGYESCGTALVPAGSVILSTRAPIGKIQIATQDLCTNQGCKALVRKCKQTDIKYLAYYLFAIREQLEEAGTGTTFRELATSALKNMFFLLPPPAEQQRIAAYLDEQCGEIDKVLAKTRESIEEYKKLKQSVITEAVTKGIRPDRPMKPSGIEWIGDIPAEWGITSIGRMCFVTKLAGFEFTNDMMANISDMGEVPIVRAQNIKMGKFLNKISEFIPLSLSLKLARCALDKKSLLITFIGAGIGEVAIFNEPQRYHLAPNVAKIEVNKDMKKFISEEFLLYFLMSSAGQEEVNKIKKATAQPSLSMETIRSMKCIVPLTLVEQQEIVNHLDQQCAEIDCLIAKKEQIISELESYKKSLIYECVTGKREVAEKRNLVDIFGKAAKLTAKVAPLADLRAQQISAEAAALSAAKVNLDAIKNRMFGAADEARIQRILGDISRLTPVSPLPSIQELIPKFELPPIPPVPDSILQSTRWVSGMIEEQRKMFELPPFSKMPDDILQSTRWVSQMIDDQRKMLQPFQADFKNIAQMLQSTADLIGSLKSFATVHSRITKDWDAIWKNLRIPVVPEIRQKKRAAYKRWAEFGWSCHPNIEFSEIPPESSEIADQFVMQELENYGVDKFIEELSKMVAPNQNEDFESAVFNFKHGYFRTCARVIFSLIDREFIIRQPKEVRPNGKPKQRELAKGAAEIFRKTLDEPETAEKILNRVPRFFYRCENMFYAVITIFESANDFRDEDKTVGLNRNFVDHGMSQRQATKKHCLQLFLLYYNVLGLFSFFDHIWPIKDERWLPTEKNDAESGRDEEDSE